MKLKILLTSLIFVVLVISLGSVVAQSNHDNGDSAESIPPSNGGSGDVNYYPGSTLPDGMISPLETIAVNYEELEALIAVEPTTAGGAAVSVPIEGGAAPGAFVSAVENVKKDFIRDLVDVLRETGRINTVNLYVVQFNIEINSLKEEIRNRISEQDITVKVVSELAQRKLSEIIEVKAREIEVNPTKQEVEQELRALEAGVSIGVSAAEMIQASEELENAPREFRAKVYTTLKAGSDELKFRVLEQFKQSIRIQTRTKVDRFRTLRETNIETIRSLLDQSAQLSEIMDAVGA